jgi:membrane-associated phospholipid phosphatase
MKRFSLALRGLIKYVVGLLLVGLLLFLPAGSFRYWNGWLFLGLLFVPILLLGIVLLVKSPELLEKRLNAKEKEGTQRGVVACSAVLFIAGIVWWGLTALSRMMVGAHYLTDVTIAGLVTIAAYALMRCFNSLQTKKNNLTRCNDE